MKDSREVENPDIGEPLDLQAFVAEMGAALNAENLSTRFRNASVVSPANMEPSPHG